MHFRRFDFADRRTWYANSSANLSKFSTSVAISKARKALSLDDISNALPVLHVFVEGLFDHHTCRLRSFGQWSPQDIGTLTFWFDRLFEAYRMATASDARPGRMTCTETRKRLSLQNLDLQSVLYIIQSGRVASLTENSARAARTASPT
ncbi:hypothetical protein GQ600_7050 [Phytophthora cactorum]|nr:hypothetical protein GQ600_7050 [Phytophthora cactorum]